MKFLQYILYSFLIITLSNCASYNYTTDQKVKNNSSSIYSSNLKTFKVHVTEPNTTLKKIDESTILIQKLKKSELVNDRKTIEEVNTSSGSVKLILEGFKNKPVCVTIYHPDYEQIKLTLTRSVRIDALVKDIALSLITFGIPIIIDPLRTDFYKINKDSNKFSVKFEYTQKFMKSEYEKISSSQKVNDFNTWLSSYPTSNIYTKVIDHRDSLEFSFALQEQKESAIDSFIESHQKSKFLAPAQAIKDEMKAARELFTDATQKNTVEDFENFLSKFPNSLHNKDAHRSLVIAAETRALNSGKLSLHKEFINNYLIPNSSYFQSSEIESKQKTITDAINTQFIKDFIKTDTKNLYQNYSDLWKAFTALKLELPARSVELLNSSQTFQAAISDMLFNKLKESTTSSKQASLFNSIRQDFPNLTLRSAQTEQEENFNIIETIIEKNTSGTGLIKLFNIGYIPNVVANADNWRRPPGPGLKYLQTFSKWSIRNAFKYKDENYTALDNIDYEEINFKEGRLEGVINCYSKSKLSMSILFKEFKPSELTYFIDGKKVKTNYYLKNENTQNSQNNFGKPNQDASIQFYCYEFENTTNLTLKNLDQEISKVTAVLKSGDFNTAISKITSLRKNNYPPTLSQNTQLDKLLNTAKSEKAVYDKKQEEIRLAEQRKRDEEAKKNQEQQKLLNEIAELTRLKRLVGLYKYQTNFVRLGANGSGDLSIDDWYTSFDWTADKEYVSIVFYDEFNYRNKKDIKIIEENGKIRLSFPMIIYPYWMTFIKY
jgi:hypothetical protein